MNKRSRKHLQEAVNNSSCYVLITCGQPSENGEMQVEMTYSGDPSLASLLVLNAQSVIDQEVEQDDFSPPAIRLIKS